MFRSIDNGDRWTQQNGGLTALDVNSVVMNAIGHIFADADGGVFRPTNDAEEWSKTNHTAGRFTHVSASFCVLRASR
jgi:hypothetical protein